MSKHRLVKPVLYLPVRPILVPCDFDPEAHRKVEYRQYIFGVRYIETDLDFNHEYVEREIKR